MPTGANKVRVKEVIKIDKDGFQKVLKKHAAKNPAPKVEKVQAKRANNNRKKRDSQRTVEKEHISHGIVSTEIPAADPKAHDESPKQMPLVKKSKKSQKKTNKEIVEVAPEVRDEAPQLESQVKKPKKTQKKLKKPSYREVVEVSTEPQTIEEKGFPRIIWIASVIWILGVFMVLVNGLLIK
ncbi:uncharacterized protein CELE_Y37H2A.14 [Caenorhabditis elegans]|uniref:Transmembrane protein n=1 Tax=Caenorhabditis elegans TaxID=6239 RepID=A5PEY0_CAEEL|nr:Transmembrane protein [Caenorhabditis elegans]CAN99717.1 Transmembrane protein [Caenorhabditis elegans]|eukprot:NP_001256792.1 Uncharacterized protein CELE_Y37H2A.14 [Caenorhabditis elegans]